MGDKNLRRIGNTMQAIEKAFSYILARSVLFTGAVLLLLSVVGCGHNQSDQAVTRGPSQSGSPPPAITYNDKFYDIASPDKDHIWVVGYFGTVIHSSDEGKTFTRQVSGTTQSLTGVFFINSREGWVVGDQGTILHTKDGGKKWEPQKSPVLDQKLLKVQFVNEKEGFAVGTFGVVLSTKDGGVNWERLPFKEDVTLNDLFFSNAKEGYIVGEFETILRTTNGGRTFEKQRGDQLGYLFGITFEGKKGVAVGTSGKILVTQDGKTWKEAKKVTEDTLFKVKFFSSKFIAVGVRGAVLASDTGQDWSTITIPGHYSWLSGIIFNGSKGYLVGNEGKILMTADKGATWTRMGLVGF